MMTTKLTEAERRSAWRLAQRAKVVARRPSSDAAVNELLDSIRREARELEAMLLRERLTK